MPRSTVLWHHSSTASHLREWPQLVHGFLGSIILLIPTSQPLLKSVCVCDEAVCHIIQLRNPSTLQALQSIGQQQHTSYVAGPIGKSTEGPMITCPPPATCKALEAMMQARLQAEHSTAVSTLLEQGMQEGVALISRRHYDVGSSQGICHRPASLFMAR